MNTLPADIWKLIYDLSGPLSRLRLALSSKTLNLPLIMTKPVFTMYHTDWCPHSKLIVHEWDLLDSKCAYVDVVKVDCERSDVSELRILYYPTLLLVWGDQKWEYNPPGPKSSITAQAMSTFAMEHLL